MPDIKPTPSTNHPKGLTVTDQAGHTLPPLWFPNDSARNQYIEEHKNEWHNWGLTNY